MATKVNINGSLYARPDAYSSIISGVNNPIQALSYGNVLIVDDGIGTGWGGGSGVSGQQKSGKSAVYSFNQLKDFQAFVKGGQFYDLAQDLFLPTGLGTAGVSNLYYVRAAVTTSATSSINFANGLFKSLSKDEGINANGVVETNGVLSKGYAQKLIVGTTTGTFAVQFWKGSFVGLDPLTNLPYGGNAVATASTPTLLFQSPNFVAISDLITWAKQSSDYTNLFVLDPTSASTGNAVTADITSNAGYKSFTGGTETFNSTALDLCLEAVKNIDNTFFFTARSGVDATGTTNTKILSWIQSGSFKYAKYLFVGGGNDATKFNQDSTSSVQIANYFNSQSVVVVHGGALKADRTQISGFRTVSVNTKTANVLGRGCGLEPQVPLTFKTIGINGELHELTDAEKEIAIANGVLYTNYDYELANFIIGAGYNTLLDNQFLVDNDGNSYSISVERIKSQLCKEVIVNSKRKFFSTNSGPNRNTVTQYDITSWLGGFLTSKTATTLQDNLIITWRNIQVTVDQDIYYVTFEFVPNFPVEKLVFSGKLMLN